MIEQELLAGITLAEYLARKSLSTENVLIVTYELGTPTPEPGTQFPHNEWISRICYRNNHFLTSTYEGIVTLWSVDGTEGWRKSISKSPIKGLALLHSNADMSVVVYAMCTLSGEVSVYRNGFQVSQLRKDAAPMQAVAAAPHTTTKVAACGQDGAVLVWRLPDEALRVDGPPEQRPRKGPLATAAIEFHLGQEGVHASALCWPKEASLFSGSWDHSLRCWDMDTGVNVATWNSAEVIWDVAGSPLSHLLATADADRMVRVWDPRAAKGAALQRAMPGHTGFVTGVAWSPASEFLLASNSHDKCVCIHDIRSTRPLHTVRAHSERGLAVCWATADLIAAGGADTKMRVFRVSAQRTAPDAEPSAAAST